MVKMYLLYRSGELLGTFNTYEEANGAKYSGKYSGHWDSFHIDEFEVNQDDLQKVFNTVIKFMIKNDVTCEETIHQCDWVIANAYELMTDLFNIVEEHLPIDFNE